MPLQGHLRAVGLLRHFFQCSSSNEIMVEFHDAFVTQIPRRYVVVLYILRVEATTQLSVGFPSRGGKPFAKAAQLMPRVDAGQRIGQPATLKQGAEVRPRTAQDQAVLFAGLQYRRSDCRSLLVRT